MESVSTVSAIFLWRKDEPELQQHLFKLLGEELAVCGIDEVKKAIKQIDITDSDDKWFIDSIISRIQPGYGLELMSI